jgi:hypothetical protein
VALLPNGLMSLGRLPAQWRERRERLARPAQEVQP